MAERSGGGSWLKWGCLGCLGIVGVVVLLIVGVVLVGWMRADKQEITEQVVTQEIPAAPEPIEVPGHPATAGEEPSAGTFPETAGAAGKVILDLQQADFRIEPGGPGEPLRVEASYDTNAYSLEEGFDAPEGGNWTYRVAFRRTAPWLSTALTELFGGGAPKVRIVLPVDAPIELVLKLAEGGTTADLGGLWLTRGDLDFQRGGLQLSVDEPLREPMESLRIRGSMGGLDLRTLGNASPRNLDIGLSMGGGRFDLRGRWSTDSEITVRLSMGGGQMQLPRDVVIEGLETDRPPPDLGAEVALPTLRFTAASRLDEVEIVE